MISAALRLACLAVLVLPVSLAVAAPLAQRHPYQKALRDYFATLTETNFALELKPVTYVESCFADVDAAARAWMFFLTRQADIPSHQGLRVASKHFTLAAIEAGDAVNISPGRGGFMDPKDVAWWTQWDYPGNPYYGSKPGQLRAFVAAAADMIMQDEEHDTGRNLRSDFLGGSMIRFAYTFRATRSAVPEAARRAYAEGLVRMFEKLETCRPQGSGGSDMEFFQLSAMWYAADALGGDYPKRALARAHVVIDTITSKTGYEKHGGAFDVSYQGIALRFLTWGAMLYNDPKISQALHKMLVLKSHLSLPEPDGSLVGPTHFNTGTAADAPGDQWAWVSRDAAMGMIDDLALYAFCSRVSVPDEAAMRAAVKAGIEQIGGAEPSGAAPGPWKEVHWVNTLNFAYDLYRPGFYRRLTALLKEQSPLTRSVYDRPDRFIRDLNGGGEFLAVRFDDYAAVVHVGALARQWASGVSGKSGGGLSAFWAPGRGTVLLGRCRATQGSAPDEWTDANGRGPYTWAVHAITGRGPGGKYFSTARIRDIESHIAIEGDRRAVVTISGSLAGHADADPGKELHGSIGYRRELRLDAGGVAVESGLTTDGRDALTDLWEVLPVRHGPKLAATAIEARVGDPWRAVGEAPVETAEVRITRYGKPVSIVFDKPRRVKLAGPFEKGVHGGADMRNLMIDLAPAAGEQPGVSYRIR